MAETHELECTKVVVSQFIVRGGLQVNIRAMHMHMYNTFCMSIEGNEIVNDKKLADWILCEARPKASQLLHKQELMSAAINYDH